MGNGGLQGTPSENYSELNALTDVVSALQRLQDDSKQRRVLETAATFLGLGSARIPEGSGWQSQEPAAQPSRQETSFSRDRAISPKEFLMQKQPQTDVERVTCLAYYLTHYRDTPYFKTIDISTLNTEAAQPKFSNAAVAVNNAALQSYLVQGTKGTKQLSAPGELFVQALPDRDAARTAMAASRPRRRKRTSQGSGPEEEE
jgi:hypothetical protein